MPRSWKFVQKTLVSGKPISDVFHVIPRVLNVAIISPKIAKFNCSSVVGLQQQKHNSYIFQKINALLPVLCRQENYKNKQLVVQFDSDKPQIVHILKTHSRKWFLFCWLVTYCLPFLQYLRSIHLLWYSPRPILQKYWRQFHIVRRFLDNRHRYWYRYLRKFQTLILWNGSIII